MEIRKNNEQQSIETMHLNTNWDNLKKISDFFNTTQDKKYDFYKYFTRPEIIKDVSENILYNYPREGEDFDEITGEVIYQKPSDDEIKKYLHTKLAEYTTDPDQAIINVVEEIPIVLIDPEKATEEYNNAGAFVIGGVRSPLGIGIFKGGMQDDIVDIQHELVHLATNKLTLGSLKNVPEKYNEFHELTNGKEINRHTLASNFIDEVLAYGTNAFAHKQKINSQFILQNMFYADFEEYAGFNLKENGPKWAAILNQTIEDRTGKKQFKLNNYLIKKVESLDDLDLTRPEIEEKVNKLMG